jgi:ABC-2 type transport system permease protein
MAYSLLGYLAWIFVSEVLGNIGRGIRGAATAGTLEQMCLSPAPLGIVLTGRTIAHLATSVVMLGTFTLLLRQLAGVPMPMTLPGLPVALLTALGVYGFGYIVGGVVLLFRQIESFTNLLSNLMLFLNGTLLPVALMPDWLSPIARVMPSTQGVVVLRNVVLDGQTLSAAWADGSLMWLTIHSLGFLAFGYAAFALCERTAKRNGSLGQY